MSDGVERLYRAGDCVLAPSPINKEVMCKAEVASVASLSYKGSKPYIIKYTGVAEPGVSGSCVRGMYGKRGEDDLQPEPIGEGDKFRVRAAKVDGSELHTDKTYVASIVDEDIVKAVGVDAGYVAQSNANKVVGDTEEPSYSDEIVRFHGHVADSLLYKDDSPGVGEETEPTEQGAVKYDNDKTRIELFPPEALFGISEVLTFGAKKYADRNWEKGMDWSRIFGALMRHLWCWFAGKQMTSESFLFGDLDSETGMSHLWHAGCCITFLIAYEERGVGNDDRPGE